MLEWYWALFIAGLVASIGGILHVIVPPFATDWKSVLQRYAAAWIVGVLLGVMIIAGDSTIFDTMTTALGIILVFLVISGYTAIDIIKQILEGGGLPPIPMAKRIRVKAIRDKCDEDVEAVLDDKK